ncbi:MAG: DUF1707 domain-containing protein [Corynebacterium sp.]|nr:DUF1707 domain-containing protein [Corynebacterium sp.]
MSDYLLSNDERDQAMEHLSRAFTEGRLTVEEFDTRVQQLTEARTRDDLLTVFSGLPTPTILPQNPTLGQNLPDVYTAAEIEAAIKHGAKPKLGILGVSFVLAFGLSWAADTPIFLLTIVPLMWILLYLLKVGPADWNMPSTAQLQRARLKQLQYDAQLKALETRGERKKKQEEFMTQALELGSSMLKRKKGQ